MYHVLSTSFAAIVAGASQLPAQQPPQDAQQDAVASALASRPIGATAIFALAFHPDGRSLALGTGDGRLILWDFHDGSHRQIHAHENWTFDIAFSSDGRFIATGGGDNLIKVREVATGDLIRTFTGHTDDIHSIAISHDNTTLYSAGDDRRLIAWNLETGAQIYVIENAHDEQIPTIALSPDGSIIATGSRDDTVRIRDANDGTLMHTFAGHVNDVLDLAFTPDGRRLTSASYDTSVRVWNVADRAFETVLRGHSDRAFAVAAHPLQPIAFTGGEDHRFIEHDLSSPSERISHDVGFDISRIAISPDGTLRAWASSEGLAMIDDVTTDGFGDFILRIAPTGEVTTSSTSPE